MKTKFLSVIVAATLLFSCDVDKTQSGKAPEVDVDVNTEEGKLPKYDVDWANVKVDTRTKMVKVPKVMVVMEEKEVEVPYIKFNMPDSLDDASERTIRVEVELTETMGEIEIEKIYASKNNLYVISEFELEDEPLNDKKVRISDQVIINAPNKLIVKHYIIGDKPVGSFNDDYKYISNEDDIKSEVSDAVKIYED